MQITNARLKEKEVESRENKASNSFSNRHLGPSESEIKQMLEVIGVDSLDELISKTIPRKILSKKEVNIGESVSEHDALKLIKKISSKNKLWRSYIGGGFYGTITPPVILRNIFENPGWYTQYTPYQAEISQGRLEALLNFQTMVMDLTSMEVANASMLDEGSAAAEAMMLAARVVRGEKRNKFFIANGVHEKTIAVLQTRAEPLEIKLEFGDYKNFPIDENFIGAIVQYPSTDGEIYNYSEIAERVHKAGALLICAADLLSLTLLTPPGEWGADIVVGNTQRFGVPLGFGGPHAAYFACRDEYRREIPGRIIGVSKDASGRSALRLAIQTREQHIRREKATSNICTAQVLLAVAASMYAVYHGAEGLSDIGKRIKNLTETLVAMLKEAGVGVKTQIIFDTFTTEKLGEKLKEITSRAKEKEINLKYNQDSSLTIALDETVSEVDICDLYYVLTGKSDAKINWVFNEFPLELTRTSQYLTAKSFNCYRTEHELTRYINRLQSKDLSLTTSMIPLGSCTMKLNATAEMLPITWPELNSIHPFAPLDQAEGYLQLFSELEAKLSKITGLPGISLQPNAGSQGEYLGLLVIRDFFKSRGESNRNVCLIPHSAHGTNPASAAMVGMQVVVVACDADGNVDIEDLKKKLQEHQQKLAALMITYPSTHGVFEESITEITELVHKHGGLVYMDGANLNAQVGLCRPGEFGVDVLHMNLHKTFCIPHGGGGPGVGPIAVRDDLIKFLPKHDDASGKNWVCMSAWGSASILPIPWMYMTMMGEKNLKRATEIAILNANYISKRLEPFYPTLYRGKNGFVAHECILDLRNFKKSCGIDVTDVAKRLMDFNFHAPTVSFPVVETLMVEPTESESKAELDRFCEAMIVIREEIQEVESGKVKAEESVLKNAPHTAECIASDNWTFGYSREKAAYPASYLREHKFWPAVRRVDSAYGDRNFFCSCS